MRWPPAREPFGFRDGIGHPAVEGSGIPGSNSKEEPFKAGEFVLGYLDETGAMPPMPRPEVLGRNGTYVVFRKLHQRVAAFRQYLKENAGSPDERGAAGGQDDGAVAQRRAPGAVPHRMTTRSWVPIGTRNNDFMFSDDATGYKTPPGSHVRRANPRDAQVAGVVRLHRMIRRGTAYGPELPEGVARGRRRRSRADVRIRRCTPRAAVRVRPIRVDEWRRLSRPGRREGSDRGCPGRRRRVLLPAEADSEDACVVCRSSCSHAAASTASCHRSVRCAGSRSSRHDPRHGGRARGGRRTGGSGCCDPRGRSGCPHRAGDARRVRRHGRPRRTGPRADARPCCPAGARRPAARPVWHRSLRSGARLPAAAGARARGGGRRARPRRVPPPGRCRGRRRPRARGRRALRGRAHGRDPERIALSRREDHRLHGRRQPAPRGARIRADRDTQRCVEPDVGSADDAGHRRGSDRRPGRVDLQRVRHAGRALPGGPAHPADRGRRRVHRGRRVRFALLGSPCTRTSDRSSPSRRRRAA